MKLGLKSVAMFVNFAALGLKAHKLCNNTDVMVL